ncbi:MAG: hypothetical protein ACWA41_11085 [Putridiphycobacter sp.]
MRKAIFLLLIFITSNLTSKAQDTLNFSFYFKSKEAKGLTKIDNVSPTIFATYELKANKYNEMRVAAGDKLKIDSSGIYISKNKLISISKKEVRENGKYNVVNGYLFGVDPNDSIPVVLQDDRYYFLRPSKAFLFKVASNQQALYEINQQSFLILSAEENDYFSVLKVEFNAGLITLSELDLTYAQVKQIEHIKISENKIDTYILSPLENQWPIIFSQFEGYDVYQKQN